MPRPRKVLSPLMIAKIARLMFNGFDSEEISLMTGFNEKVVREFRKGSLNPEIRAASLNLKDKAIERIKTGKGKTTGLIWFMSRRYPRQFADPATQITLASGNTTHNTLVVTAEVAEQLVARSKTVSGELEQLIAAKNPDQQDDTQ